MKNNTCPVCITDFVPRDAVSVLPDCQHVYHRDCWTDWTDTCSRMRQPLNCRVCRRAAFRDIPDFELEDVADSGFESDDDDDDNQDDADDADDADDQDDQDDADDPDDQEGQEEREDGCGDYWSPALPQIIKSVSEGIYETTRSSAYVSDLQRQLGLLNTINDLSEYQKRWVRYLHQERPSY